MVDEGKEQILAETKFGTVTNKRVTYFAKKGFFSGGSQEDLPLRHVTSVRFDMTRKIGTGIILILIGLFTSFLVLPIILIVFGVFHLWGVPTVVLNTAGGDLSPSRGYPWQKEEADKFTKALRSQLFQ